MQAFFAWYLTLTILGWLTFPLVYRLFPALADRGYSLARAAGLLLWSYVFWLLASLHLAQNDLGGLLLGLFIVAGVSLWTLRNQQAEFFAWLKTNLRLVVTVEALFLLAFAFLAMVRAATPDITGTEKPMELMFINSILRSPTFPPHDSWLSGYAISYYYFGYVMTAILAKLTAIPGSVAFNLMVSLVFALSALGAYGVIYNLLAASWESEASPLSAPRFRLTALPLIGPLFLLVVSNWEGFLEVLHRRGLFWHFAPDGTASSAFWTWLGIKDLNQPPTLSLGWVPERYLWWWRASRVVQDYTLSGQWREVIDEFPFFSYLLADLHPHVLAMPFDLLAVAVALHLFLGGWCGETNLFGWRLSISKAGFLFSALVLGGLAFLNTWDVLFAVALMAGAYLLARVHEAGWDWARLEDFLFFSLPVGLAGILLYLPFYFGFSSQAGGILPDLVYPTRGAQLWVMFGPLLLPVLAYVLFLWRGKKCRAEWPLGLGLAVGVTLALWAFSWLMGIATIFAEPDLATQFLQMQGVADMRTLFLQAGLRRMSYIGGLLTLLAILGGALAFLASWKSRRSKAESFNRKPSNSLPLGFLGSKSSIFVLLLVVLGGLLVLAPDFVYLRDQFGYRINTIFKFYYQAWILWSLAAAFGAALLLCSLHGVWEWIYRTGLALLLLASLTYPVLGLWTKTNGFQPSTEFTLDGAAYIQRADPDEAAAIRWLDSAPPGVIAEAVGGSYTNFARISTNTGLPTVLGWPGHESQWRGGSDQQGTRQQDIQTLYSTPTWSTAESILRQYDVRYVYIGSLERTAYTLNEVKFQRHLETVFHQGNVVIYEVP